MIDTFFGHDVAHVTYLVKCMLNKIYIQILFIQMQIDYKTKKMSRDKTKKNVKRTKIHSKITYMHASNKPRTISADVIW